MRNRKPLHIRRVVRGLVHEQVIRRSYVTRPETAAILGYTLRWVYALARAQRLPSIRRRGQVLVPVEAVLAYARRRGR